MKREVKIGIFAVVILCCSWAGIRFLNGVDIFRRSVDYYVSYPDINGISSASPVLIQGVKVGAVTGVLLNPRQSNLVTIKLSIKRRYALPEGTTARIYTPGLMSSTSIGLTLGESSVMLNEGDTILPLVEEGLMDKATSTLFAVADQIAVVGEELSAALSSINEILDGSGSNIENTLSSLDSISTRIDGLLGSQSDNIEQALGGISQFSATLGENAQSFENMVQSLESLSADLSQAGVAESLSQTIEQLNATLSKVNGDEGSAAKLLSDEQLYDNLAAVSANLSDLLIDMQANPKRYVHFSLFGSKSN